MEKCTTTGQDFIENENPMRVEQRHYFLWNTETAVGVQF